MIADATSYAQRPEGLYMIGPGPSLHNLPTAVQPPRLASSGGMPL
jgi:hypothetical protein